MDGKLEWTTERMDELYEGRKNGKTLADLVDLVYSKYGVKFTPARISQVIKHYTQSLQGN